MSKWQSYIQGPKWAGLKPYLYEQAAEYNLQLTITANDRGWLRETVYFDVEGDGKSIAAFGREIERTIESYNQVRHERREK